MFLGSKYRSAVVATLVKARQQKRVTIGLPLVSRSNLGGAAFANCTLGVAFKALEYKVSPNASS